MAATQKPGQAPAKGKKSKRNESQESAQAARERKREAKRKGLKPGSRQGGEQSPSSNKGSGVAKDPRIGSRKPVALVVETKSKPAKPVVAKPEKTPEQLAEQQARQQRLKLEQELTALENNERLNTLLDRLDEDLAISAEDEAWLDKMLARHQELLSELGIEDEDDEEPSSPDDLLQRFIEDDFDPSEIDPEYKPGKK
ncbi:MAG: Der GTPase-activating protein YihI [Aeromonadaceae bacterium]